MLTVLDVLTIPLIHAVCELAILLTDNEELWVCVSVFICGNHECCAFHTYILQQP